ncbi:MAG: S8 family serine peptidase [Granulosicoccus sp.]
MKTRGNNHWKPSVLLLALTLSTSLEIQAEDIQLPAELSYQAVVQPSAKKTLALEHIDNVAISTPNPSRLLPTPVSILPQFDSDVDGVPNEEDICPNIPNAKIGHVQPLVCGSLANEVIDKHVFLRSRTFTSVRGVDPALSLTPDLVRIHALLHLSGPVSNSEDQLNSMGVRIVGYVPRRTFMVSVPRNEQLWNQIVNIDGVQGLSALDPADRVAPYLRVYGPAWNANQVSRLDVEFFNDVPPGISAQILSTLGLRFSVQDETHYTVDVQSWHDIQRLALVDGIKWIEESDRSSTSYSTNTWATTDVTQVVNDTNLRGHNLVVAMGDFDHVPEDHPAMAGRVTKANAPVAGKIKQSHANQVAAIMVSDGTAVPDAVGYLPEADLISYRVTGLMTTKRRHYRQAVKAREDYDAVLFNNSWGHEGNCNKIGDYTQSGKWRDKAVHDSSILLVDAAGNTRGLVGSLNDAGCGVLDLGTLPHSQAKNDLMVGNWDISLPIPVINSTSAAGPTTDGRLKPDVVAPGNNVSTIYYIDDGVPTEDDLIPSNFAGTSAAAPVASGIAGMVYEQLLIDPAVDLIDISADQVKAVMIHTAKDVGIAGPDYRHGYGLVQAAPAVRIASEWAQWGRNDVLLNEGDFIDIEFDIDPGVFQYKATLVWTDVEGSPFASLALVNDLDLTLISPGNNIYFPWDLTLPAGDTIPATPGMGPDSVNNVEQVVVTMPNGDPLETGTWTARIAASALVEPQWFSLVLTPPCPIVVSGNVTLNGDVQCTSGGPGVPAIEIVADDSELNCGGYSVTGNGLGTGVLISANNVSVTNCDITEFDTGVESNGIVSNAVVLNNNLDFIEKGVVLSGNGHRMTGNSIGDMLGGSRRGFVIDGDGVELMDNNISAGGGANVLGSVGIEILPSSDDTVVHYNNFSGFWQTGVLLHSSEGEIGIHGSNISHNEFEGIGETALVVHGNAPLTVVKDNDITLFGLNSPAILVEANESMSPENVQLLENTIEGAASVGQIGIELDSTVAAVLSRNNISDIGIGILEEGAMDSQINENSLWANLPFFMDVGISSIESKSDLLHIFSNSVSQATTGVFLSGPDFKSATGNSISAFELGISIDTAGSVTTSTVSHNTIDIGAQFTMGVGISVTDSPEISLVGNIVENTQANPMHIVGITVSNSDAVRVSSSNITIDGDAISINDSDEVELSSNTTNVTGIGIAVLGSMNTIQNNTLFAGVGVRSSGDDVTIEGNIVGTNTGVGIHLIEGLDAFIGVNTVTSSSGTGIRLGNVPPPCAAGVAFTVDNALLENNIISAVPDVAILCDVDSYTITP